MNKSKSNKGITLVALIITVIVLLILTVVAIRAITGDGLLDKAKTATNSYEDKRREEENMLGSYADMIDANMPQNTTVGEENTEGNKYYLGLVFDDRGEYTGQEYLCVFINNENNVQLKEYMGQQNGQLTGRGEPKNVSLEKNKEEFTVGEGENAITIGTDAIEVKETETSRVLGYINGTDYICQIICTLQTNFDTSRLVE